MVSAPTLPDATVGQAYRFRVLVSGGIDPYAYSTATAAFLPPGIALDAATGELSGTPTQPGTYSFELEVQDAGGQRLVMGLRLEVLGALVLTIAQPLPDAVEGQPYSETATASGGTPPYTYAVVAPQALPAGLSLDASTGAIAGTPQQAGSTTFDLEVQDAAGHTDQATTTLVVRAPFAITTAPGLPPAVQGQAYSTFIRVTGGQSPYLFGTFHPGPPPQGLRIDAATGELAGTPVQAGTFTFDVEVQDAAQQTARETFTLTVQAARIAYHVGTGHPFATVTAALDQVAHDYPGGFPATVSVIVHDGTYHERAVLGDRFKTSPQKRLVLTAAPGDRPIFDGKGIRYESILVHNGLHMTIRGFDIIDGYEFGIFCWGEGVKDIVIENNRLFGCSRSGVELWKYNEDFKIRNNVFAGNGFGPFARGARSGLGLNGNAGVIQNIDIANNTFYDNDRQHVYNFNAHALLSNNIYAGLRGGDGLGTAADGNYLARMPDPLFAVAGTSRATADFHLLSEGGRFDPSGGTFVIDQQTSAAIDYGRPGDPVGLETRPNGGRINAGAYGGTAEASRTRTPYEVGPGRAFATISDALAKVQSDFAGVTFPATVTVVVYDDTYTDRVLINDAFGTSPNSRLVISAAPGNRPVLDGSSLGAWQSSVDLRNAAHVTIRGFDIVNGNEFGLFCMGTAPGNEDIVIERCRFFGNSRSGIELWQTNRNFVIRNNVLAGNGFGALAHGARSGFGLNGNAGTISGIRFSNNTLFENNSRHIYDRLTQQTEVTNNVYDGLSGGSGLGSQADGNYLATGPDPLFVLPTTDRTADFHLRSAVGRFDPVAGAFVQDAVTSTAIDYGRASDPVGAEPSPNGGRVNAGAFGGTREASMR